MQKSVEALAKEFVELLKKDNQFKNNENNVDKFLDIVEELLYEEDIKACSDFKNGVYNHVKLY